MRKSLSLKREALAELTSADLVAVAAGQQQLLTHATCTTCTQLVPSDNCFSLEQCRTLPVNDCISLVLPGSLPC